MWIMKISSNLDDTNYDNNDYQKYLEENKKNRSLPKKRKLGEKGFTNNHFTRTKLIFHLKPRVIIT